MSETAASSVQGRVIRAALILFPVGTVILGIGSFGIWWMKRVKVEERSYKYALALRRDLTEASLQRHADILREVLAQPPADSFPAVAAYLESSMGAENMGYQVRRDRFHAGAVEMANVEVELTGRQRPREIVLLLAPHGDGRRQQEEALALASVMALAHSLTGESRTQTLRFAAVPLGQRDENGTEALARLAAASRARGERLMQVLVLGGLPEDRLAQVRAALRVEETGTRVLPLPAAADLAGALAAARGLRAELLQAVE